MDLSLPYLAGFFDGEGSIGIYTNGLGTGRTLRVQLTQTVTPQSTALLTAMRDRWGGSLCPFNRTLRRNAWNWQVSAGKGIVFLRDVRPWLLLKADQADVVLTWWPGPPCTSGGPGSAPLRNEYSRCVLPPMTWRRFWETLSP